MGYEPAINKAWDELTSLIEQGPVQVRFLADEYSVDVKDRKVFSLSCNVPAKDYAAILILHYLINKKKVPYEPVGKWISFRELSGGDGYWPTFRKRVIGPIVRKHGSNPEGILSNIEKLGAKKAEQGQPGIVIEAFDKIPVLVELWPGDEEFSPDANVLFDQNIERALSTEDIVVMTEFIVRAL